MQRGPTIRSPQDIRFIHQTISTTLSKPKPGEIKTPNLDALANEVKEGRQSMLDFPAIEIFSIHDQENDEEVSYSLNNRKLYIAKKSGSQVINTINASFDEILDSVWKMTSMSDGLAYPTPTHNSNKACQPVGLLLQFRSFLEENKTTSKDTPAKKEEVYQKACEQFHLQCRR